MSKIQLLARDRRHEEGMTAIFVTMIMIFVISVLVLGFALLSRREQRSSLDTQLSTQAYYAAESGVNDAIAVIGQQQKAGKDVPAKTQCASADPYNFDTAPAKSQLSAADSVSYTCVLVDPAPKRLDYKNVGSDGVVVPVISAANTNLTTMTLTWAPIAGREANPTVGCPANTNLPPDTAAAWKCGFPMLRVESVPTTTLNRAALQANAKVKYLKPVAAGGSGSISVNNNATVEMVKCTNVCSVTINGLSSSQYYLRVNALYGQVPLLSVAATDAAGPVGLKGAQALIDSTGKAQGVMRRIAVTVDLTDANAGNAPTGAIVSGESICKRFAVGEGLFTNNASGSPGASGPNTLCK